MWHHMYGWGDGFGGIMMGVGLLFWLAVLAAAIALVIWAVRTSGGRSAPSREPDALEIARRRYARGEITREQFEQLKQDLTK